MEKVMAKTTSIAALEQELQTKKRDLDKLMKQRSELLRKVAVLDKQIGKLQGSAATSGKGGRRGPRSGPSLIQRVVEVLAASKKPLGVKDIAEKVLAGGYQTTSKNIHTLIWAQIYKDDRIVRPERGRFALKAGVKV